MPSKILCSWVLLYVYLRTPCSDMGKKRYLGDKNSPSNVDLKVLLLVLLGRKLNIFPNVCCWLGETCLKWFCWLCHKNGWKNFRSLQPLWLEQLPRAFLTPYLSDRGGLVVAAEKSQSLGDSWLCSWSMMTFKTKQN